MDDMTHRRAVSPVIATVILIAVAVAIGIAVAFWASGLTTSFSKYEKLGVNAGWATKITSPVTGWVVNLQGDNSGSSAATVSQVQVNGVPWPTTGGPTGNWSISVTGTGSAGTTIASGGGFSLWLYLQSTSYSSGQTVEITLVSAAGTNYPKAIVLP